MNKEAELLPNTAEDNRKKLSRREFIKSSGLISLGASLAISPLPLLSPSLNQKTLFEYVMLEDVLELVYSSDIFLEIEIELQNLGLLLHKGADLIKYVSEQEPFLGGVLLHSTSNSLRMGGAVAFTFNLDQEVLTGLHLVVARCLVDTLCISSQTFDYRDLPYEEQKNPAQPASEPTDYIRPRQISHWTFPQENAPEPKEEDLIPAGWPAYGEDPSAGYWHFSNASAASWCIERDEAVYRITEVLQTQYETDEKIISLEDKFKGG